MAEELELVKISELPETSNVAATDVVPVVQNGVTKKTTVPVLRKYVVDSLGSAAKASTSDFEPAGSVLEIDLKGQARADEQNKRIDRIEVAAYLLRNNKVFKAYRNKALMLADVANIPANSLVQVVKDPANDPETNDINGQYHYDGTDFLKLPDGFLDLIKEKAAETLANSKLYTDGQITAVEKRAASDAAIKADDAQKNALNELIKKSNSSNAIYTALVDFLYIYESDLNKLILSTSQLNPYSFNQKIIDLLLDVENVLNKSRFSNQEITAFYAFIAELNKLDKIDLTNNHIVPNSFASDMHIPTDKFGVNKGELKGVVLKVSEDSTAFDAQDIESPYIIYDGILKKFVMVYTGYAENHSKSSIGWAVSDDLMSWTKKGELITASGIHSNGDQYGMTGPCLYYYNGLYYLYYLGLNGSGYEGEPINMCLATTPSLINPTWTYHGIKIPIQTTGWANQAIYHANLFTYNGKWWIFFNARGVVGGVSAERFGYAVADSINGNWQVSTERVSEPLEVNKTFIRAGDPSLFEYEGLIYVFYFSVLENEKAIDHWGWTTPAEFPNNWRYGGDLLDNIPSYQSTYAHKPFVVKKDNILYHYYTAVGDQGRCIALKTYDI